MRNKMLQLLQEKNHCHSISGDLDYNPYKDYPQMTVVLVLHSNYYRDLYLSATCDTFEEALDIITKEFFEREMDAKLIKGEL